ncbi:MAG: hypothetical protein FWF95_02375 [Syntrophorhabdaceae bacterium]|nr:hypothetical protein [Syntrophorhabdaceae bacterium]
MLLEREKKTLIIVGVAAAALLIVALVVFPAISRIRVLSRNTVAAQKNLAEVRKSSPDLQRVRQATIERQGAATAAANSHESPLTQLTSFLQGAGIPASVLAIKSAGTHDSEAFREELFEVHVENLTYLEAVNALRKLSAKDLPVIVRSTVLKSRYDDQRYLDMTLRVGHLSPKKTP